VVPPVLRAQRKSFRWLRVVYAPAVAKNPFAFVKTNSGSDGQRAGCYTALYAMLF